MSAAGSSSSPSDLLPALPEQRRVLESAVGFFRAQPGTLGVWVSGSVARGVADEHSDLDVGVLFDAAASRARVWEERWEWQIAPWFHRFDADHVKEHFVIYLFEPGVKADFELVLREELRRPRFDAARVVWDATGELTRWVDETPVRARPEVDWSTAWHDEERFWAWTFYCVLHLRRGEYYEIASAFYWLREVVELWHARLHGAPEFDLRRAEQRGDDLRELAECFPEPTLASNKRALLKLIEIHDRQRERVERERGLTWRTTPQARRRIRAWVEAL